MPKWSKSSKVSSTRAIELVGYVNGKIKTLPLICVRKNCIRGKRVKEAKAIKSRKHDVLGVVSHPGLYKSRTAPYVTAWCHPYRNPSEFLDDDKPQLLLSESDFVDPLYVYIPEKREPKWDFFYFTMGGQKGARLKGLDLFVHSLPYICGKLNMKGLVINYTRKPLYLNKEESKIWKSHKSSIRYLHKKLVPKKVASIMVSSRFGLFANARDCSPLLLAECLIRNTPVLVNEEILGGWKYVNEDTGRFFDFENVLEPAQEMLGCDFNPKERFLDEFGFVDAAKRLAEFGREHLKSFYNCEMACFAGLSHVLEKVV